MIWLMSSLIITKYQGDIVLRVFFKSFGPIRRVIGESVIELKVGSEFTIRDVINFAIESYGDKLKQLILEETKLSGNLIVLLNGRDTNRLDGLDTKVSPDDEITILPHVQGG